MTPHDVAQELRVDDAQGRRLCAQLERDGVLRRVHFEQSASDEGLAPESKVEVIFEELCYAFEPERPYLLDREKSAATPSEIARLSYGQGTWGASPPAIYRNSQERFAGGFLEAYLRQRLPCDGEAPNPLVVQIGQVRRALKDEPLGAFETVLRLLEPKMPPVLVEFAWSVPGEWNLDFNRRATRFLNFQTRGPGVPFGALEFESPPAGIVLGEHLVRARRGRIEARFEARGDLEIERKFVAPLHLKSHFSRAHSGVPDLEFRVTLPRAETLGRVGMGALIGAGVLGVPRLAAMFLGLPRSDSGQNLDVSTVFADTLALRFPLLSVLGATAIFGAALYVAFRFWVAALRRDAQM